METPTETPSERSRVRRLAERGRYDRSTIYPILDEGLVAHVGFTEADGRPVVIPTAYARDDDRLVLHGHRKSRMFERLAYGEPCSVCVTLLDGVVLARSIFSHSMNYRSVVVHGVCQPTVDRGEKRRLLHVLTEHLVPGRWEEARRPTDQELDATAVVTLSLADASAKVRSGPPGDLEKDLGLQVWAGVIPARTAWAEPEPDPELRPDLEPPLSVTSWSR